MYFISGYHHRGNILSRDHISLSLQLDTDSGCDVKHAVSTNLDDIYPGLTDATSLSAKRAALG